MDPSSELLALGVNVALGGFTAGVRQWRGDGSFLDGLWRGAIGGAGTYAGKRIVTSDFTGSGIVGRGVAAVGASMTRNASEAKPLFDRLILPVGFVRLHWRPVNGDFHASIDVAAVGAIAGIYMSDLGASLDVARTLESGAPVFMARDWQRDSGWSGRHIFGAVLLRGDEVLSYEHEQRLERALHHERVHVLQYDQAFILWNDQIEHALLGALGSPDWVMRRFDLSLTPVAVSGLKVVLPHGLQVWEDEAHMLAGTRGDLIDR
jgi:hypothetical protein